MKKGIFVALAALALAVFAVPDAHAWWKRGPDVNQRVSGSTFNISVDEETGNTTNLINSLAKGQPGRAHVQARLIFGPPLGIDVRCPKDFPIGLDIVSFDVVTTYNDGSLLAGEATPGQAICASGSGGGSISNITGIITDGTGRFEGASGTWESETFSPVGNILTGTFIADLDGFKKDDYDSDDYDD